MRTRGTTLKLERLEERETPSCSMSNFYGEIASTSEPGSIGAENSGGAHYWQDQGLPAAWGEVNQSFGWVHGCN